ncbi:MAG: hypothetical protein WKG07_21745 [Hymenobacter sp.]
MAFASRTLIMEPLWNRNYIEHVQISVTESLGGRRPAGLLRRRGAHA